MSITVTFTNIEHNFDELIATNQPTLSQLSEPIFESYKENLDTLKTALEPYQQYKHILLVGNGGSIWSFMPFYTALKDQFVAKEVVLLTDMEPDRLAVIKKQYPVADSLVLVISKSGSTVGAIENLFALSEYKQLYVTDLKSTLGQIGEVKKVDRLVHPPVGGRYSSFTSCAYVPAHLAGLPIDELEAGGRAGYELYRKHDDPSNPALATALYLHALEEKGYTEVFLPIYSNFLQTFGMIATQLFHESFGKAGKGLTVVAAQAPESQHHTNQRFFGGQKNMVGCFLHVVNQTDTTSQIAIPEEYRSIPLRSGTVGDLNNLKLADAFTAEYVGTFTDAKNQGIPLIDIAVEHVDAKTVGQLMAFWHYVTVYSAALRGVDPYDQPQVEASKVISFEQRLKAKE